MPDANNIPSTSDYITKDCKNIGFRFIIHPHNGLRYYSNIAVDLLGIVIEKLEHKPFRKILKNVLESNNLYSSQISPHAARNDVAFGLHATTRGLANFLHTLTAKRDSLTGFATFHLPHTTVDARLYKSRVLWLQETPFEEVWEHGGYYNGKRSLCFYHPGTKSGITVVSARMKKSSYSVILNTAAKIFQWPQYEKVVPNIFNQQEFKYCARNSYILLAGPAPYHKK